MPKHDAVHPKLTENDIEGQLQLGKKINQAGEGGPPTTACGPHGDRAKSGESPTAAAVPAQPGSPQTQRGRGAEAHRSRDLGVGGVGASGASSGLTAPPRHLLPPARSGKQNLSLPGGTSGPLDEGAAGTQAGGGPRTARTKGWEAFGKAAGTRGSPVPGSERMRAWTARGRGPRPPAPRPRCPPPCSPRPLRFPPASSSPPSHWPVSLLLPIFRLRTLETRRTRADTCTLGVCDSDVSPLACLSLGVPRPVSPLRLPSQLDSHLSV